MPRISEQKVKFDENTKNMGNLKSMIVITNSTGHFPLEVSLSETLERLRLTSNLQTPEWLDLLQMSWFDYQDIKINKLNPSENAIERLANHFKLTYENIQKGSIDYKSLALRLDSPTKELPEAYSKAAYGRKRTSITSMDFVERYAGWRLRLNAIHKLNVSETLLQDPFAPISMQFITDLCAYLYRRQFRKADFYAMGAYTYEGNKNSVVGKLFSEMPNAKEAYEFFFNDCMKLFEQNCNYTITRISDHDLSVEYVTNPNVAAEAGVKHLGNTHVCQVKIGLIANIPRYLGLPAANIKEVSCVHCGDDVCRLEIDFSLSNEAQLNRFFSNQ